MIRYISDLHFGHENIINFDKRPFNTVEEMNNKLIENWNSVVNKNDITYILGDFCWLKKEDWIRILDKLNGSKVLIKGNHDLKKMSKELKSKFSDIKDYKEISDNGRKVILSHYPIIFYKSDWNKNIYHLYGHVHMTNEWFWLESFKRYIEEVDDRGESKHKCQMYNVGCMLPYMDYTPKTLDEIVNDYNKFICHKEQEFFTMFDYFDDYFDDSFEELRAEAYKYNKDKQEAFLKDWCNEAHIEDPIGYDYDFTEGFTIYTRTPGSFIGKQGILVSKYTERLHNEFSPKNRITFKEIKGFTNI